MITRYLQRRDNIVDGNVPAQKIGMLRAAGEVPLPAVGAGTAAEFFFGSTNSHDADDWVEISDCAAANDEEVSYVSREDGAECRGVKFTPQGASTVSIMKLALGDEYDLSATGTRIIVEFYIHEGQSGALNDYQKLTGILIVLYNGNDWKNYDMSTTSYPTGANKPGQPGYHIWSIPASYTPTATTNWADADDLDEVDGIGLRVHTAGGATHAPEVTLLSVKFVSKPKVLIEGVETDAGIVCLTFDDIAAAQSDAVTDLATQGLPATFYATASAIDTGLTTAQLEDMLAAGHQIANHGQTSGAAWNTYAWPRLVNEIVRGQARLASMGVPPAQARCLAGPGGFILGELEHKLIARGLIDQVRGGGNAAGHSYTTGSTTWCLNSLTHPDLLYTAMNIELAGITLTDVQNLVDDAITYGGIAVIYGHAGGDPAGGGGTFADVCSYIKGKVDAGSVICCTMQELLGLTNRRFLPPWVQDEEVLPLAEGQDDDGSHLPVGAAANELALTCAGWGTGGEYAGTNPVQNGAESGKWRKVIGLDEFYQSRGPITVRARVQRVDGAGTVVSGTVDCEAYELSVAGAPGADLCRTAAQTITTSDAEYSFNINTSGLTPGDRLEIILNVTCTEAGNSGTSYSRLNRVEVDVTRYQRPIGNPDRFQVAYPGNRITS